MVRLTDRPDMTLDAYRGRKTTTQQIKMITDMVNIQHTLKMLTQQFIYIYRKIKKNMKNASSYFSSHKNSVKTLGVIKPFWACVPLNPYQSLDKAFLDCVP